MSEEQRLGEQWDAYPAGMKVLAVDDDPLCLKVVAEMLRRCNYEVMTAPNGKVALEKLRDRSAQYDLVLSDVYMPDMDGFKLLELIGLELDLPVIMMSSNGETQVVLRGVTHGAVDYLIKPVRIEELRNVWQHVVRRRREHGGPLQAQNSREYSGEDGEVVDGSRSDKKRKESPSQGRRDGQEDTASAKKPRVVWSVEMHQQFVNAVNTLGIDKAVPKRILDQMQVDGLTRENVASHLQKYRLYLKRVAGVQLTPSGRGKASRSNSLDAAGYSMMGMQPPMSMMPQGGLGGLSDQEQLRMSLQMAHMRNQQAAMGSAQAEGYQNMPLLQAHPMSNGSGMPIAPYGAVTQPQSSSTAHRGMPMEDQKYDIGAGIGPGTSSAMLGMNPDNLAADSAMGLGPRSHQGYDMGLQLPHEHELYQNQLLQQQQQHSHLHHGQGGMALGPTHSLHDETGMNGQPEGDMNDLYISFLQDQ